MSPASAAAVSQSLAKRSNKGLSLMSGEPHASSTSCQPGRSSVGKPAASSVQSPPQRKNVSPRSSLNEVSSHSARASGSRDEAPRSLLDGRRRLFVHSTSSNKSIGEGIDDIPLFFHITVYLLALIPSCFVLRGKACCLGIQCPHSGSVRTRK